MLVYRIENESGLGPYQSGNLNAFTYSWDMCIAHSNMAHCAPHVDPDLEGISSDEFCGCDSIESLLSWFYEFLEALEPQGFNISVYEIAEARVGANGQTLFKRNIAGKRVARYLISEAMARI
jgi:hypothetical protein